MSQQTQQSDSYTNLSKQSIEKLLKRSISDDYYNLLLKESLHHLLETKENEEYE